MNTRIIARKRDSGIFHLYSRKRTYVRAIRGIDLLRVRFNPSFKGSIGAEELYYIECDKFGNFDQRQANIFVAHALVGVDNVFIVNPPQQVA